MQKICCTCEESLPLEAFSVNKSKKDGLNLKCKECNKAYQKEHYKKNPKYYKEKNTIRRIATQKWWQKHKSSLECEICGEKYSYCLQFHHKDPSKKEGTISNMIRHCSKQKLLDEIDKCIVLCANCHIKTHHPE